MAKKVHPPPPNQLSVVAEGTVLEGTLWADGAVQVSGHIIGTVTSAAQVMVASPGVIDGVVTAAEADVAGGVAGDLDVAVRLVLRTGAHVEGDVKAAKLIVEEGAHFNGVCRMAQGEAPPRRPDASRPKPAARSFRSEPTPTPSPDPPVASAAPTGNRRRIGRATRAVLGIVLVMVLAAGAYYGVGVLGKTGQGGSADLSAGTGEGPTETEAASAETLDDASVVPVFETQTPDPSDFSAPIDSVRQASGLDRIAMEQARRRVLGRSMEPEVAALFQQAETVRQDAMRHYEAENFDQAAPAFRTARDLFDRMQQVLDEQTPAREQQDSLDATPDPPTDPITEALADSVAETPADPIAEAPADPVAEVALDPPDEPIEDDPPDTVPEEDTQATLEEVQTVIRRLARQLKLTIEREDAASMQALYYRGWEPFFGEAEAINAVVRPENVRLAGTEALADVYLDLSYQDEANQARQRTQAYVWTLMRLGDEWILRRVSSQ